MSEQEIKSMVDWINVNVLGWEWNILHVRNTANLAALFVDIGPCMTAGISVRTYPMQKEFFVFLLFVMIRITYQYGLKDTEKPGWVDVGEDLQN